MMRTFPIRRAAPLALLFVLAWSGARAADTPPGYAIASAHPLATAAGAEILEAGGNAFDAAVAISAALAVVEPYSSGIGGGGFWLLHREPDRFETFVDGRETAPMAATRDMYLDAKGMADARKSRDGALAAAIPAAPAAWAYVARKYGSKPLAALLAPAVRYARDGFAADPRLIEALRYSADKLSPAAAAVFLPGGQVPAEGQVIRQGDLATTLERLGRDGPAAFYQGDFAGKLVDGVRAGGGIWSGDDLARYKVVERKPLSFFFRDYRVVSAPPPSAGGVVLGESLAMLEARGWPAPGGALAKHLVIESLRRAFRDRQQLGDPDFVSMPLFRLLSREYLLGLARGISLAHATRSDALEAPKEGDHTTHFSVIDGKGNRVAGTLTINLYFGSGFMPPGTGVLLNDEMDDFSASLTASNAFGFAGSAANAIAPGKRPLSSMAPTFVEGPRGLLVVGTPGGSRIPSMVLLATLAFTQGAPLADVVGAPRYHHQYLPDQVEYEAGAFGDDERAQLEALGHTLKLVPRGYGNLQAVWWDKRGDALEAASDPRGVGAGTVKLQRKRQPQ